MVNERIKEKLQAVPAKVMVQDQLCSGSGVYVDHEEQLYTAITNAFYNIVNECAKRLGYPLVYCQSRGVVHPNLLLVLCCLLP